MTNSVTPSTASPFDALRKNDERGEHWFGRDLMRPLGYLRWERFEDTIDRAKAAAANAGVDISTAFMQVTQLRDVGNLGIQEAIDYRLTRYAAYLVAMNGDPRKTEVAGAQSYFATKTREAEAGAIELRNPALQQVVTLALQMQATQDEQERLARVQDEQGQQLNTLVAKVSASQGEHDEFTAMAYAKLNGLPVDKISCQRHGQRAARLMRSQGRQPRKVQDAIHGTVNVYPVEFLDETAEF